MAEPAPELLARLSRLIKPHELADFLDAIEGTLEIGKGWGEITIHFKNGRYHDTEGKWTRPQPKPDQSDWLKPNS